MSRFALAPVLLVSLAGCAVPVTAPPLEKRPVEAEAVLLPEDVREPAVPADAALADRLSGLVRQADAADTRFGRKRQEAEQLVRAAEGAVAGSESWTIAQQAVSALEAARGPLRGIMDDVEQLRGDPAQAGSGARAAIGAAADHLAVLDGKEAQAVSALARRLR